MLLYLLGFITIHYSYKAYSEYRRCLMLKEELLQLKGELEKQLYGQVPNNLRLIKGGKDVFQGKK